MGGLVVTAFFVIMLAVLLLGRRYRTTTGEYDGPTWFSWLEIVLFLTWAALSVLVGSLHPRTGWGIYELVLGAIVAVSTVVRVLERRKDRQSRSDI